MSVDHIMKTFLLFMVRGVFGPVIVTDKQWLCHYCSMGAKADPDDCGLPILCIFYCLLFIILVMFFYQTIKGERDFRKHDQITPHMSIVKR